MCRARAAAATVLLISLAAQLSAHSNVVELSQGTFDAHTSAGKPVLVEFYAPWCTHCRRFEESYTEVAASLSKQGSGVSVARVDGSDNRVLAQRFKVTGFPSFYLIDGTSVVEFVGPRSVDALVEFASSGGATHAKKQSAALGPFHLYWRVVGAVFGAADHAATWVEQRPENMMLAAIAAVMSVLSVVAAFAIFIHVITKPAPPRPHAE